MTIQVNEINDPNLFRSKHWVHTKTGNNKELLTISGIALPHWKGTGSNWERDTLNLFFSLPPIIPDGMALRIEQWTPLITLNAIYNKNHAVNAGWAVDEFWGPGRVDTTGYINLWANIAIRDIDGWLYRVAYNLTILGSFVKYTPPDIN